MYICIWLCNILVTHIIFLFCFGSILNLGTPYIYTHHMVAFHYFYRQLYMVLVCFSQQLTGADQCQGLQESINFRLLQRLGAWLPHELETSKQKKHAHHCWKIIHGTLKHSKTNKLRNNHCPFSRNVTLGLWEMIKLQRCSLRQGHGEASQKNGDGSSEIQKMSYHLVKQTWYWHLPIHIQFIDDVPIQKCDFQYPCLFAREYHLRWYHPKKKQWTAKSTKIYSRSSHLLLQCFA